MVFKQGSVLALFLGNLVPRSLFFPSRGARERETRLSLSLAPLDGKKRDPGNEVDFSAVSQALAQLNAQVNTVNVTLYILKGT